jgi:Flp pilus assembly protein TadG
MKYGRSLRLESGQVVIEFGIALLCVLTMCLFTIEFCGAIHAHTVLADATSEGVRYAMVHSADPAGTEATVRSVATYTLHDVSKMQVSITYPDGTAVPPARVAISVTYPYVPWLTKFMENPPTMRAFAEGRLVR